MAPHNRNSTEIPKTRHFIDPILRTLERRGGSATVADMLDAAVHELGLTKAQLELPHDERRGKRSEVSYRMAWARTQLKAQGLIEKASRGSWRLTEKGRERLAGENN